MQGAKAKGIGLLSGGLDSILAVKVLQQQELDLVGVIFMTPFFGPKQGVDYERMLGIPVMVRDIGGKHLAMLKKPVYGYGSQMNPCIDCHGLMLREAGKIMEQRKGDFLFTGEVLGQRPMSQRRDSLRSVEKLSGYEGRVLRPLSAKLLPPTTVELEGKVDRSLLLDIHGRSRKRQMALAKQFGIEDYPQPGGGCILTKQGFVKKLQTLFAVHPDAGVREAHILSYGRLFQLPGGQLCVVGRDRSDNESLEQLAAQGDRVLRSVDYPGPRVVLLRGCVNSGLPPNDALCSSSDRLCAAPAHDHDVLLAAQILASYSDAPVDEDVLVEWKCGDEVGRVKQSKAERHDFQQYMV